MANGCNLVRLSFEILHSVPEEFDLVTIIGDGNCLYRAFSYHLQKNQHLYPLLRNQAMTYINQHPDDFKGFFPRGTPSDPRSMELDNRLEKFIQLHSQDREFADDFALFALANILSCPVLLFRRLENFWQKILIKPLNHGDKPLLPVCCLQLVNEHYQYLELRTQVRVSESQYQQG